MPSFKLIVDFQPYSIFGEVDLSSVLSGLLYRNEWSSISGILTPFHEKAANLIDLLLDNKMIYVFFSFNIL